MAGARPIRFLLTAGRPPDGNALIGAAREAERLGYSAFGVPDHFMMPLAPLVALQAVADATTTVRLSQCVLNMGLRHPAVLAKELATIDVLSGGRVEVGIGAGWMRAEHEQAGIPFDDASTRMDRLEEAVAILKGLFADEPFTFSGRHFTITNLDGTPKPVQRPRPPIMVGGGGRKLLTVAGRHADIVQLMPAVSGGTLAIDFYELTAQAYEEKLGWLRDAAGDRFADIELGAQLRVLTVTDRPDEALDAFVRHETEIVRQYGADVRRGDVSADDLMASPVVAIGTLDQVCDKLLDTRDRYGISYFAAPVGAKPDALIPVIEPLTGK